MAFDVGVALFHIAEATRNQDRAGLQKMQIDFRSIEELIYGKLNEPPSAFVKLIDAILEILPDVEVKTEPVEEDRRIERAGGIARGDRRARSGSYTPTTKTLFCRSSLEKLTS